MATEKERIRRLLAIFSDLDSERHRWNSYLDDIGDFVSPARYVRHGTLNTPVIRNRPLYDNTATEAAKEFSAIVFGLLMNPAIQWLGLQPIARTLRDRDSVLWIQETTEELMSLFRSPQSNFYGAGHELLGDWGSFGISTQNVVEGKAGQSDVIYETRPIAEIYPAESGGVVDTVVRRFEMTADQAEQLWGFDALSDKGKEDFLSARRYSKKRTYLHFVLKRTQRDPALNNGPNKPFESTYIDKDAQDIVSESGFNEFPYMVARFAKTPGEVMGNSPVCSAIEEVKMAQVERRTMISARERISNPTLQAQDNSVLGKLNLRPGGMIYRRPGSEPITAVPSGDPRFGDEALAQSRQIIRAAYFLDKLSLPLQDRMTATEVIERRRDALQVLAPFVARLQNEYLAPMVTRTLGILFRKGRLNPVPPALAQSGVDVEYISPLAVSQRAGEVQSVQAWLALMQPAAQIDPTVMQTVDWDELAIGTSMSLNVPQRYVKDIEVVRQERAQIAQQQQLAAAAQIGGDAADAVKTAAEAENTLTENPNAA